MWPLARGLTKILGCQRSRVPKDSYHAAAEKSAPIVCSRAPMSDLIRVFDARVHHHCAGVFSGFGGAPHPLAHARGSVMGRDETYGWIAPAATTLSRLAHARGSVPSMRREAACVVRSLDRGLQVRVRQPEWTEEEWHRDPQCRRNRALDDQRCVAHRIVRELSARPVVTLKRDRRRDDAWSGSAGRARRIWDRRSSWSAD